MFHLPSNTNIEKLSFYYLFNFHFFSFSKNAVANVYLALFPNDYTFDRNFDILHDLGR